MSVRDQADGGSSRGDDGRDAGCEGSGREPHGVDARGTRKKHAVEAAQSSVGASPAAVPAVLDGDVAKDQETEGMSNRGSSGAEGCGTQRTQKQGKQVTPHSPAQDTATTIKTGRRDRVAEEQNLRVNASQGREYLEPVEGVRQQGQTLEASRTDALEDDNPSNIFCDIGGGSDKDSSDGGDGGGERDEDGSAIDNGGMGKAPIQSTRKLGATQVKLPPIPPYNEMNACHVRRSQANISSFTSFDACSLSRDIGMYLLSLEKQCTSARVRLA